MNEWIYHLICFQDSVVAIPVEFKEATVLGNQTTIYQFLCSIDGNEMTYEYFAYINNELTVKQYVV